MTTNPLHNAKIQVREVGTYIFHFHLRYANKRTKCKVQYEIAKTTLFLKKEHGYYIPYVRNYFMLEIEKGLKKNPCPLKLHSIEQYELWKRSIQLFYKCLYTGRINSVQEAMSLITTVNQHLEDLRKVVGDTNLEEVQTQLNRGNLPPGTTPL